MFLKKILSLVMILTISLASLGVMANSTKGQKPKAEQSRKVSKKSKKKYKLKKKSRKQVEKKKKEQVD